MVLECGRCMLCTCFCFCEAERTGVQRGLHVSELKRIGEPGVTMSAGSGLTATSRGRMGRGCRGKGGGEATGALAQVGAVGGWVGLREHRRVGGAALGELGREW